MYACIHVGVILPGDMQRFLFTFKSGIAGIFSESWELCTHPVLLGGASMEVTLRGVALYEDKLVEVRQSIQVGEATRFKCFKNSNNFVIIF